MINISYLKSFCHIKSDTVRQLRAVNSTVSCQLSPVSHLFPVEWENLAHVSTTPISSTADVSPPVTLKSMQGRFLKLFFLYGRLYNQDLIQNYKNQAYHLLRKSVLVMRNHKLNSLKRQGLGGLLFQYLISLFKRLSTPKILKASQLLVLYPFGDLL